MVTDHIELRLGDGLGFTATRDPATAALMAALDGTRTLGEAADDLARLEGTTRAAVEQAVVRLSAACSRQSSSSGRDAAGRDGDDAHVKGAFRR